RRPAAPVHRAPARLAAQPRRRRATRPRADPGPAGAADRRHRGLPVPPALPAGARRLPRGAAAHPARGQPHPLLGAAGGVDLMLEAVDLVKHYPVRGSRDPGAVVHALDGVSLTLKPGRTLGIVGESGCGKSTLAKVLVRLEDPTAGQVLLDGTDLTALRGKALREQRRRVQMVFQDPNASLNPR